MIKITKILLAGGACPYQLEAETDDGRWVYLRYRSGWLRAGVVDMAAHFEYNTKGYNIINEQIGKDLDGWPNDVLFKEKLKDKLKLPDGFKFEFGSFDCEQEADPREAT